MMANMDRQEPSRANAAVCDLCFTTVTDYMTNPCAHVFCWDCIFKFRNESNSSRGSCPTCFFNKNPETSVQHRMKDTRVYQASGNSSTFYTHAFQANRSQNPETSVQHRMKDTRVYQESRNSSTFYTHAFQANRSQPLQLVSTTSTGQLELVESTVKRCFLECEDHPVYVISVVGERRAGKSFLMNYLMRALRSLERTNKANLGDNEVLNGFPWGPGADKATKDIWIWGKPFLLENNGNKVAVFLLDSEGTDNTTQYEPASIKLRVLNMMISSHLVYNVKTEVKQTDIDYVEIYCDPSENNPYHPFFGLQHFDVLVRDWSDTEEDFGEEAAKHYIKRQIQDLGKRHVRSILNLVEKNIVRCFLMPYPGDITAEDEDARLRDMDEDFQNCLRRFLMCVVERTQKCESAMTCKKMAEKLKVCVEYVENQHFSTPNELCNQLKSTIERKTEREMERINTEFETFLNNQTQWRLPSQMSDVVSKKVSEVIVDFYDRCLLIRGEHRADLVRMLLDRLKEKSDTFCDTHRKNLKYNGLKTAVHIGLMAAASAAMPFLFPAAAPAAAGGWFASIGGWFSAAPAAATTASSEIFGLAAAGVAMLQGGAGFLLRRFW